MKFILNIPKFMPILLLTLVFTVSCSDDDNDTPDPVEPLSIVETALATPDLSSLVAALQAADGNLIDVINSGTFTVLAPTNAAFESFLAANGFANLGEVPTDVLSNILLNHVITGEVMSTDLVAGGAGYTSTNATNADGDALSLYYNTSDGVRFNGVASVTAGGADVEASNGVVHIIDAVIGLPTVVTFATADPTFETLVAALTRDDLTFNYVETLSSNASPSPFTVFAPTNEAFGALLTELGIDGLGDIEEPVLKATLDHHAVALANVRAEDLSQGQTVGTLGGDITISLDAGAQIIDANGRTINIIATNVQAFNGVVHAIDTVILPPLVE